MAVGRTGLTGLTAVKHVEEENPIARGHVLAPPLVTGVKTAQDTIQRSRIVEIYLAQVIIIIIITIIIIYALVDCKWDEWSEWSVCTVTCDGGLQFRSRNKTEAMHNGEECVGSANETKSCNTQECPSKLRQNMYLQL